MRVSCYIAALVTVVISTGSPRVSGADWPMYGRDATRNAVSPERNPPIEWDVGGAPSEKDPAPPKNIKWRAELGSVSFGSPVIANGLIWICSNNERPRDPAFVKDAGTLLCFREADGKFLWQSLAPRIGNRTNDWPNVSVGSTPLIDKNRVWFVNNRWEVECLDVTPLTTGGTAPQRIWSLDLQKEFNVFGHTPDMGMCLRGMVAGPYHGLIFVVTGNGVDDTHARLPSPDAPAVVCLDAQTGKLVWKDNSCGAHVLHGQWGTPLVGDIAGRPQVIVPEGDGWLRSFDPMTGKLLWSFDANFKRATYPSNRNLVMAPPVLCDGRLYVTTGQSGEHGEGAGILWCIDPSKSGDISAELDDGPGQPLASGVPTRKGKPNPDSAVIWKFDVSPAAAAANRRPRTQDRMNRSVSSVAVDRGLVIAVDFSGYIHCFDATTGERYWCHDGESTIAGSPLICDEKVYVATEEGHVIVLKLAKTKQVLAENNAAAGWIHCSPVYANGVLYVAAHDVLYAIANTAAPAAAATQPDKPQLARDRSLDWPQWRGPDRTNIAPGGGLLPRWPEGGPPLLWKTAGLGDGVASVALQGGVLYTLGYRRDAEFLTALDALNAKPLWEARVGPAVNEQRQMRWLSQRTPSVDGDRIYAVTARGELVCFATADGRERWRKDYKTDFGGIVGHWGFCDFPMVDGDRLIITPGGKTSSLVALDKRTGNLLWSSKASRDQRSTYSTVVAAEIGGIRQCVQQFDTGAIGVGIVDGTLLWESDAVHTTMGNVHTSIVSGDTVFCSAGWGEGMALLKVTRIGQEPPLFQAQTLYRQKDRGTVTKAFGSWLGNSSLIGDHIYTNTGACIELAGGRVVWQAPLGQGTVVIAENHLYFRQPKGTLVLAEVNPKAYVEASHFLPPRATSEPAWTSPVIADRRLYLRDQDELLCYDLRADATRPFVPRNPSRQIPRLPAHATTATSRGATTQPRPENDAIFVPTPQDVVERMLTLAAVGKNDVVYDLGCGDGRIVVTAAARYGCRAAGYDIDPQCIKLSQDNVRRAKVEALVDIQRKDVFTLDLSGASVVTLYMGRDVNRRLVPQLQKLKPGSRVVSHNFEIEGYQPDQVNEITSADDDTVHTIYLFTTPLKQKQHEPTPK
jgi:outer membrane protein assembly factor BamB/precorrin-6B methylase 2